MLIRLQNYLHASAEKILHISNKANTSLHFLKINEFNFLELPGSRNVKLKLNRQGEI